MDIISQLQEQVNTIASLAFNTFGTLQRDAPPVRLSPNYPEPNSQPPSDPNSQPPASNPNSQPPASNPNFQPPASNPNSQPPASNPNSQPPASNPNSQPPSNPNNNSQPPPSQTEDAAIKFADEPKTASAALVKAAKQFDALVNALPLAEGGEEAQLKRIAELQAENDVVGQELQRQLEAADEELRQVQELFSQATDNCLNMKKPY